MLPASWVDRIFAYMSGMYGRKFSDMWEGTDLAVVKSLWAEKLGGFEDKPEAIKQALDALEDKPWPPTLPEFLALCRDAAKRMTVKPLALEHKFTEEEMAANRARVAGLVSRFGRAA